MNNMEWAMIVQPYQTVAELECLMLEDGYDSQNLLRNAIWFMIKNNPPKRFGGFMRLAARA